MKAFAYSAGMKDFSKGSSEKWSYDHLSTSGGAEEIRPRYGDGLAASPKEDD